MKKILIVDDHIGILRLLSLDFIQKGYTIVTAINGKEALKAIGTEYPDAVLLDVVMPVMNGFEMLARLREYSDVPVIMHSFDEHNKETAFKLGANAFVLKPADTDKLQEVIERLIAQPAVKIKQKRI